MMQSKLLKAAVCTTLCAVFSLGNSGCKDLGTAGNTALGGILGAGGGAAVGGAFGGKKGALWGAIIGGIAGLAIGYYVGNNFEKEKATEAQQQRARDRGHAAFDQIRQTDAARATELTNAAKAPVGPNDKPVRFLLKNPDQPNSFQAYDPATDTVGTDMYVVKPDVANKIADAGQAGKAVDMDGYKMIPITQ